MSDSVSNVVNVNVDREERKVILAGIGRAANRGGITLDQYTDKLAEQLKMMNSL